MPVSEALTFISPSPREGRMLGGAARLLSLPFSPLHCTNPSSTPTGASLCLSPLLFVLLSGMSKSSMASVVLLTLIKSDSLYSYGSAQFPITASWRVICKYLETVRTLRGFFCTHEVALYKCCVISLCVCLSISMIPEEK